MNATSDRDHAAGAAGASAGARQQNPAVQATVRLTAEQKIIDYCI
jgi:hypothetical protein